MALIPGTRLGPYEIVAPLGAGGMGEVCRARDTKLNRDVALKVLLPSVARDPDRLARFSREAQLLASLNHPNIAHIHGLEDAGGVTALVLELVEGEDLALRLTGGPLPLDEALPIARQIAEALESAHEHGIIHRDLKPANVKIRSDGTVKVLDFGLAKAMDPASSSTANAMNSPTLSMHATQAGIILGTAAYMSPEQARGRAVDKRTDIWALGCVLFEMLSGTRAFPGDDVTDTIVAVVSKDPEWSALPPDVPAGVRRLLRRCLEKDPKRRLDSAAAVRIEIDEAVAAPETIDLALAKSPAVSAVAWSQRALPWTVAGIFGAALLVAFVVWSPWRQHASAATRLTLSASRDSSLTIEGGTAISPDGSTVAFVARSSQGSSLYVRRLDEWEPHAMPSTDGASSPIFSPDGHWVAFRRDGSLLKTPASGGPPQVICKCAGFGGSWRSDGTIVFGGGAGLLRVSSNGGAPQLITISGGGDGVQKYLWPETLPGDKGILFTLFQEGRTSVAVLVPGTDKPRILVESGTHPRYVPTGHLVYVADRHLFAVPFDLDRLQVRGGASVVADSVNEDPYTSDYDVSASGVLVYLPAISSGFTVVRKDRQGVAVPAVTPSRLYGSLALSPDGQRLSVSILEGLSRNIWIGGIANEPLTRLTFGNDDWFGVWSRDGARLFYTAGQNGSYNIFSIPTNGSGKAERLTQSPHAQQATSLSPDGDTLLFHDIDPSTNSDIWQLSLSSKEVRPLVKTRFIEVNAQFSPNGHWMAYQSDESGQMEVYVQAYPGLGSKRRVSLEGGTFPVWSHSGGELFYQSAAAMFAIPILDANELRVGVPRSLFAETRLDRAVVSADDQRFLMLEKAVGSQSSQLNVVQNWFEDLKARVPAK